MTELIREAAKRLPQQESLPSDLAAVNKRMKEIDKQLGNLAQAVALGGRAGWGTTAASAAKDGHAGNKLASARMRATRAKSGRGSQSAQPVQCRTHLPGMVAGDCAVGSGD